MLKISEAINHLVSLYGKKIIILPDFIGALPIHEQHLYVEVVPSTNECPAIYIKEQDIEEAREKNVGVIIFGLWQILCESNLISFNRELQVIKLNDEDGYYLYCELGRAIFSGVYKAGFIAADADLELCDAYEINLSIDQLKLPANEAKLAKEMSFDRKKISKNSLVLFSFVICLILFSAFSINFFLKIINKNQLSLLDSNEKKLEKLMIDWNLLRAKKLSNFPDDSVLIDRLATVWLVDKTLETEEKQSFYNEKIVATVHKWSKKYSEEHDWLDASLRSDGKWLVSIKK